MSGYRTSMGARYAIVSGCRHATEAAENVLMDGGNVFDAALAGAAVLCVTLPHAVSIGGDLFALVQQRGSQEITAINATGAAPHRAKIAVFREQGLDSIPVRGPLSVQPPGFFAGWEAISNRWGRLPAARLLEPAIKLARDGFVVGARFARLSKELETTYSSYCGWRDTYFAGGQSIPEGGVLKQERLAASLSLIAKEGAQAFYAGRIANDIVRTLEGAGGIIERADLVSVVPQITPALVTRIRDCQVATQPPISQGAVLLRALRLFAECIEDDTRDLEALWPIAASALRTAFVERARLLGDQPDALKVAEAMIAGRLQSDASSSDSSDLAHAGTETTNISVMDSEGNTASLILSIFADFGSGIVTQETGILLNNRLSGFFLDDDHPNGLRPGKRTMHTLHSVIATCDDGTVFAGGSPGGNAQPQVNLQVLARVLFGQQELKDAVAAPRWMLAPASGAYGKMDQSTRDIWCEPDLPPSCATIFEQAGFRINRMTRPDIGSAKWVQRRQDGTLIAACDQRRDAMTAAA